MSVLKNKITVRKKVSTKFSLFSSTLDRLEIFMDAYEMEHGEKIDLSLLSDHLLNAAMDADKEFKKYERSLSSTPKKTQNQNKPSSSSEPSSSSVSVDNSNV